MLTISLSFQVQCAQYNFFQVVLSHGKMLCSNRGWQLTPLAPNCGRAGCVEVPPVLVVATRQLFHGPFFRHHGH